MGIGFVLRITTERLVVVAVKRMAERVEIVVPRAVFRCQGIEIALSEIGEVVGGTLALVVAIFKPIDELQEGRLPQRFGIGQFYRIIPVFCRREIIAVGLVSRVLAKHVSQKKEMYVIGR